MHSGAVEGAKSYFRMLTPWVFLLLIKCFHLYPFSKSSHILNFFRSIRNRAKHQVIAQTANNSLPHYFYTSADERATIEEARAALSRGSERDASFKQRVWSVCCHSRVAKFIGLPSWPSSSFFLKLVLEGSSTLLSRSVSMVGRAELTRSERRTMEISWSAALPRQGS